MNKKFKVSYFQVNTCANDDSFEQMLERMLDFPPEKRTSETGHRLDDLYKDTHTNLWYGALVKVRMNNLPEKYEFQTGQHEEIELNITQGLGEINAFLYDPSLKVLLIQKSQYAPGVKSLGDYLQDKINALPIEFPFVLRGDALARFNKMKKFVKIHIKTAKVNPDAFADNSTSKRYIESLNLFNYLDADMTLRAPKGGSLGNWVKDLLKPLSGSQEVSKLEVSGTDEDAKKDVLDLIMCKLETEISKNVTGRTIPLEMRRNVLYTAYSRDRDYLRRLFQQG